jgi:hypothetical protein
MHEVKEFAIIAGYLYICFFSLTAYKVAILHTQGIGYAPAGIAIIKAVVLAKFMMIGHALDIGKRFESRPLIWETLSRVLAFFVLLCALTIVEELIVGAIHGHSISHSFAELTGSGLAEALVRIFIVLLILVPYFAFVSLGEALGKGNLAKAFFVDRGELSYLAKIQDNASRAR